MRTQHARTVEIITYTVRCDHCGAQSPASGRDALHGAGWTLGDEDVCPDCRRGLEQEAARRIVDAAVARYVEALERDEVPLVHGRIYGDGTPPRCPVPGCDVRHRDGPRACVSIAPTVRARALRERGQRP